MTKDIPIIGSEVVTIDATRAECDERNKATSREEVEAFKAGEATRYFAYWRQPTVAERDESAKAAMRLPIATIGTWMGDLLATVVWRGTPYYCPAFGGWPSTRVNFLARGIDGRLWYGTYYKSSGDYVRMRVRKAKRF